MLDSDLQREMWTFCGQRGPCLLDGPSPHVTAQAAVGVAQWQI